MRLMFVVDDDISQEELEEALRQNFASRAKCSLGKKRVRKVLPTKGKKTNNKRPVSEPTSPSSSDMSVEGVDDGDNSDMSRGAENVTPPMFVPMDVRSGVLKKIRRNGFDRVSECDSESAEEGGSVGAASEKKNPSLRSKCYSQDLKDRLKKSLGKFGGLNDDSHTKVNVKGRENLQSSCEVVICDSPVASDSSTNGKRAVDTCEDCCGKRRDCVCTRTATHDRPCSTKRKREMVSTISRTKDEIEECGNDFSRSSKCLKLSENTAEEEQTCGFSGSLRGSVSGDSVPCIGQGQPGSHSAGLDNDGQGVCERETSSDGPLGGGDESEFSLSKISPSTPDVPEEGQKNDEYYTRLSQSIPDELYVGLDCEMVGVGPKGKKSVLGRCSIVDYDGRVIYDKFVRPSEFITDFRTRWSGIRPSNMRSATPIDLALREIKECLEDKIVVGHAVYNDFKVLQLHPPAHQVRDTASCRQLSEWAGQPARCNGLKKLAAAVLGREIQLGRQGHCSVEDARASLDLFKYARTRWEPTLLRAWEKKGVDVAVSLGQMRMGRRAGRPAAGGVAGEDDFLEDRFWPSRETAS
ncbi:RNA exonuclease 4 [Aplysia californica]|uniref:RNA exonuclease 4 n=1 Tax=Aplysia californica TaxID=6500 RepID=A0ABM0JWJ1_APLCA|nr:RNA exonuclease 4 [Aplysia californica]